MKPTFSGGEVGGEGVHAGERGGLQQPGGDVQPGGGGGAGRKEAEVLRGQEGRVHQGKLLADVRTEVAGFALGMATGEMGCELGNRHLMTLLFIL